MTSIYKASIFEEFVEYAKSAGAFRIRITQARKRVETVYPTANPLRDARLTVFHKISSSAICLEYSLIFAVMHLFHREWWTSTLHSTATIEEMGIIANRYMDVTKLGYIHALFSSIESCFRILIRAIDSSACNGGMSEFKSIYECLLKSKLSSPPPNGCQLLNFMRLLRNAIHNNGVYFHPTIHNVSEVFNGVTYTFQQGKPIEFASYGLIISVSEQILSLAEYVVRDDVLRNISGEIEDPYFVA